MSRVDTCARVQIALGFILLGLAFALLGYRGLAVGRYPTVYVDEGYYAQLLLSRTDPAVLNPDPITRADTFRLSGLSSWPYRLGVSLGGVGLAQFRLGSVFWGAVLLLATFGLGRALYGWFAGGAAAAVLAATYLFGLVSTTVQPDVAAAALGVTAAWLTWSSVRANGRLWPLAGAGVLAMQAWQAHPAATGLALLPVLAIPLLVPRRHWPAAWGWLALGGALALAVFLALDVLPDPVGFLFSLDYWRTAFGLPLLSRGPLEAAVQAVEHLGRAADEQVWAPRLGALALVAACLPSDFRRRADRYVLLGLALVFLWLAAASAQHLVWYLVLYAPLVSLLLARLVAWPSVALAGRTPALGVALSLLGVAAALWLLDPARELSKIAAYKKSSYTAVTEALRAAVPPGASVAGSGTFWFALADHPYRQYWFVLQQRYADQHGTSFGTYLDIAPSVEVVILSDGLDADASLAAAIAPALAQRNAARVASMRRIPYQQVSIYLLRRAAGGGAGS